MTTPEERANLAPAPAPPENLREAMRRSSRINATFAAIHQAELEDLVYRTPMRKVRR